MLLASWERWSVQERRSMRSLQSNKNILSANVSHGDGNFVLGKDWGMAKHGLQQEKGDESNERRLGRFEGESEEKGGTEDRK